MIEATIANPDYKNIGYQKKLLSFKSFKAGTIKVVYSRSENFYIIISVIWGKEKIIMKITYDPKIDAMYIKFQDGVLRPIKK